MSFSNLEVVQESTLAAERSNMSFSNLEVGWNRQLELILQPKLRGAETSSLEPPCQYLQETSGFTRVSWIFAISKRQGECDTAVRAIILDFHYFFNNKSSRSAVTLGGKNGGGASQPARISFPRAPPKTRFPQDPGPCLVSKSGNIGFYKGFL